MGFTPVYWQKVHGAGPAGGVNMGHKEEGINPGQRSCFIKECYVTLTFSKNIIFISE